MNFKLSADVPEFRPRHFNSVRQGLEATGAEDGFDHSSLVSGKPSDITLSKLSANVPEFIPRYQVSNNIRERPDQTTTQQDIKPRGGINSSFSASKATAEPPRSQTKSHLYIKGKYSTVKVEENFWEEDIPCFNTQKGTDVAWSRSKLHPVTEVTKHNSENDGKSSMKGQLISKSTKKKSDPTSAKDPETLQTYRKPAKMKDINAKVAKETHYKETLDAVKEKKEASVPSPSWSSLFKPSLSYNAPAGKGESNLKARDNTESKTLKKSNHQNSQNRNGERKESPQNSHVSSTARGEGKNWRTTISLSQVKNNSARHMVLAGVGRGSSIQSSNDIVLEKGVASVGPAGRENIYSPPFLKSKSETPFGEFNEVPNSSKEHLNFTKIEPCSTRAGSSKKKARNQDKEAKVKAPYMERGTGSKGNIVKATMKDLLHDSVSRNLIKLRPSQQSTVPKDGNVLSNRKNALVNSDHSLRTMSRTAPVTLNTKNQSSITSFSSLHANPGGLHSSSSSSSQVLEAQVKKEKEWPGLGQNSAPKAVVLSYSDMLKRKVQPSYKESPKLDSKEGKKTEEENENVDWQELRRKKKKEKRKQKKKEKKIAIRAEKESLGILPKQPESAQKLTQTPITLDFGNLFEKLLKQSGNQPPTADVVPARSSKKRPLFATGVVSVASGLAKKNTLDGRKKDVSKVSLNALDSTQPIRKRGKEREHPKKRKLTLLRKIILKEREAKRKARDKDNVTDANPDDNKGTGDNDNAERESSDTNMKNQGPAEQKDDINVMSPLSNLPDNVIKRLHSRKFREYCDHFVTKEIGLCASELLWDLQRFHNRAYQENPIKANAKRRLVSGLREISRHVKLKRLKCILIASNLERIASEGGIDDYLSNIISSSKDYNIPIVYPMTRQGLGKVLRKKVPVSAVGIFFYDGAQDKFKLMMELVAAQRQRYKEKVDELINEPVCTEHLKESKSKNRKNKKPKSKRTKLRLVEPDGLHPPGYQTLGNDTEFSHVVDDVGRNERQDSHLFLDVT